MADAKKLVCNLDENKKKAFIALNQIVQMEGLYYNVQALYDAAALARNFNSLLDLCRDILVCDEVFFSAVKGIKKRKPEEFGDVVKHRVKHGVAISGMLSDLTMLKGAMIAFIEIHLTLAEKDFVGFTPERIAIRKQGGRIGMEIVAPPEKE